MKRIRYVIAGLAALSITATIVAAQTGGIGRTFDAIERVLGRLALPIDRAANVTPSAAQEAGRSATAFRWNGSVSAGGSVEIKGINGGITVGPASGSEVTVTTEARGRRSDPASVRIEVVEHDDGLTFCAVYPTPEGERQNECRPGSDGRMSTHENDVAVHFEILLPAGVDFVGRTVNGGIEALGLESDVVARTVNGDIEIETTGFAEAETVNGGIDALLGARDLGFGASFSTVNGSIELDLEDDVDANVDASWLNGEFESDLPFMVEGRVGRRSARGVLGDGGAEIELETVNGSIRIR